MLAKKGSKPRVTVTGSKSRTCVFGAISDTGKQCFRQYEKCNSDTFIDFSKKLLKCHKRIIYFIDRAPWHLKSKKCRLFFEKYKDRIVIKEFPKGFPESNPVESCWRAGKHDDNLGAKFHYSFKEFKLSITKYYRTKKFKKNLYNYLCE